MRFALRDDDVNYHFDVEFLRNCLDGITDRCPITLSVVPWYKGDWRYKLSILETHGFNIHDELLRKYKEDDKIYRIHDNKDLVLYLNREISKGRVSIAQHGIYHQNNDKCLPVLNNNFGIGAEFYTDTDLSKLLKESNEYLNQVFNCDVNCFTPPQNKISFKGFNALDKNSLNVCSYLPNKKEFLRYSSKISLTDIKNIAIHRIRSRSFSFQRPYPHVVKIGSCNYIDHISLQPNSSIEDIYKAIDFVNETNGDFVLSTHTYAFNYKMNKYKFSLKDALLNIIELISSKYDVEFVTLNELLR